MSNSAVENNNPLDFLERKRDNKKRKHKSLSQLTSDRGKEFDCTFGNRSSSSLGLPNGPSRRFFLDGNSSNSYSRGFDSSQSRSSLHDFRSGFRSKSLSQGSNKQSHVEAVSFPIESQKLEELPKPNIVISKCEEYTRLMKKRDLLIFREAPLNEVGSETHKKIDLIADDTDIGTKTLTHQLQSIHNTLYQLHRWPHLFPTYNDHRGVLLKHTGHGTLQSTHLRNPMNCPIFFNSAVIELEDVQDILEYLPIKRTLQIEPSDTSLSPCDRNAAYVGAIWDKILMELVIIKAEKNIPSCRMDKYIGFSAPSLSIGDRHWVPYSIAIVFCKEGLASVELPNWLQLEFLKRTKVKEETSKSELAELSPFFFETAYLFGLYSYRPINIFHGRILFNGPRRAYISKAKGLIEKIRKIRESKIIDMMGRSLVNNKNCFIIPNLQLFETYTVNELLTAIWDKETDYSNREANPKISLTILYNDKEMFH